MGLVELVNRVVDVPAPAVSSIGETSDGRGSTWSYLVPAGTKFITRVGSRWSRPTPETSNHDDSPRVLFASDRVPSDLDGLTELSGVVLANCGSRTKSLLRDRGFPHVREFAILPSATDARWFIPLDTPSIASATVRSLYTPYKRSARLKSTSVRAAARLGSRLWFRDHLVVAQRDLSPLEAKISDVLGETNLALGLATGLPGLHKPTFVALNRQGRPLAYAKVAKTKLARDRLERECRALEVFSMTGRARTPTVLFAGEVDGTYLTIQSPLHGSPGPVEITEAHQEFLRGLVGQEQRSPASSGFIASLKDRITLSSRHQPVLSRVIEALTGVETPVTVVHGDFAPWNIRRDGEVITAFDWEHSSLDGIPLVDECQHEIQVGFLLKGWSPARAREYLVGFSRGRPLGLPPRTVSALQIAGLLNHYLRLVQDGRSHGTTARAYRDLIELMSPLLDIESPVGSPTRVRDAVHPEIAGTSERSLGMVQTTTDIRRFVSYYPRALSEYSGVTVALWKWASALCAAGEQVLVLHAGGARLDAQATELRGDLNASAVPHRGHSRSTFLPLGLHQYLTRGDVLVLHEGWVLSNILAAAAAERAGVPYVVVPHGAYEPGIRAQLKAPKWIRHQLERRLLERALAVHLFFESEIPAVRAIAPAARFLIAPTGFEVPQERWVGGGGYLAWLGRYDPPHKGLDILVRAVASLPPDERPRLRLRGPDYKGGYARVRRMIASLGVEQWIEALGPIGGHDKVKFLQFADGYVHASRWESHSIALLENLSLGVPCLVSDAIHIAPALREAGAAVLCVPTVEGIARGLVGLSRADPRVGQHARSFVASELSANRTAVQFTDAVRRLARSRSSGDSPAA